MTRRVLLVSALASLVFLLGVWVYVSERPGAAAPLLARFNVSSVTIPLLGWFALHIPSFAHAFSFSVSTGLLVRANERSIALACLSWASINATFEIGQYDPLAQTFSRISGPDSLLSAFFVNGTFDPLDLLAGCVGAAAAFWLLRRAVSQRHKTNF